MVSPFSSVFIQRPESPNSSPLGLQPLPWSPFLTLANMGINPIATVPATDPQPTQRGELWHLPLTSEQSSFLYISHTRIVSLSSIPYVTIRVSLSGVSYVSSSNTVSFLYLIKLCFSVFIFFNTTAFYFCSFLTSCCSVSQLLFLFSFWVFFFKSMPPSSHSSPNL